MKFSQNGDEAYVLYDRFNKVTRFYGRYLCFAGFKNNGLMIKLDRIVLAFRDTKDPT